MCAHDCIIVQVRAPICLPTYMCPGLEDDASKCLDTRNPNTLRGTVAHSHLPPTSIPNPFPSLPCVGIKKPNRLSQRYTMDRGDQDFQKDLRGNKHCNTGNALPSPKTSTPMQECSTARPPPAYVRTYVGVLWLIAVCVRIVAHSRLWRGARRGLRCTNRSSKE